MPRPPGLPGMFGDRGDLDVETLLKIVLVLVVVLLVVDLIGLVVGGLLDLFGPFRPIISLLVIVLIVAYLFDRI